MLILFFNFVFCFSFVLSILILIIIGNILVFHIRLNFINSFFSLIVLLHIISIFDPITSNIYIISLLSLCTIINRLYNPLTSVIIILLISHLFYFNILYYIMILIFHIRLNFINSFLIHILIYGYCTIINRLYNPLISFIMNINLYNYYYIFLFILCLYFINSFTLIFLFINRFFNKSFGYCTIINSCNIIVIDTYIYDFIYSNENHYNNFKNIINFSFVNSLVRDVNIYINNFIIYFIYIYTSNANSTKSFVLEIANIFISLKYFVYNFNFLLLKYNKHPV